MGFPYGGYGKGWRFSKQHSKVSLPIQTVPDIANMVPKDVLREIEE